MKIDRRLTILDEKIDECLTALADCKVGSSTEKQLRQALKSYLELKGVIKPGTPSPAISGNKNSETTGFKTII